MCVINKHIEPVERSGEEKDPSRESQFGCLLLLWTIISNSFIITQKRNKVVPDTAPQPTTTLPWYTMIVKYKYHLVCRYPLRHSFHVTYIYKDSASRRWMGLGFAMPMSSCLSCHYLRV